MSPCPLPSRRRPLGSRFLGAPGGGLPGSSSQDRRALTGPRRPVTTGRRLLVLPAVLTALLLAMLTVLTGAATPAHAEDRVRIDLTAITPKVTKATDVVTVSGTVTNTSATTLSGVQAYLWRDQLVRTTATDLDTADGPVGARYLGKYVILGTDTTGTLTPGQQSGFTLTAPLSELGIPARDGVTMIGVQVRGSDGSGNATLGRARSWLTQDFGTRALTPRVASVVVLASAPSRVAAGTFSDDHLAREIAPGGRLDVLLRSAAANNRTHLIDPALIVSVEEMAKGYKLTDGSDGTGQADAKNWLQAFDALTTPGYRLPYATVDVDLMAGIDQIGMVRSALDATTLPADVAGLPPAVLPAGGQLTRRGLAALAPTDGPAASPTPSASAGATPATVPTSTTPPVVLAAQPTDGADIAHGATPPAHWTTSEGPAVVTYDSRSLIPGPDAAGTDAQRRAALTAIGYLDALDNRPAQVRLITDTDTAHADDLDATARTSLSWLVDGSAAAITDAVLHAPPADDDRTRDVRRLATATTGLSSLFTDPAVAADTTWRAVAAVASTQWAPTSVSAGPGTTTDAYATYRDLQKERINRITDGDAVAISARPVLLTARQDTQFPVTITNNLDVPVSVRLEFESENAERLHVPPVDVRTIGAGEAIGVVAVPRVAANGSYTVVARLTTPEGTAIGVPVDIDVQATQAGRVGWILMIVSGLVVIGTTVFRIKQVRAERSPR